MPVVVVIPPDPVVSAQEARDVRIFTDADDDDYVDLLLEIAQSEIEAPGWFGRAIGEQVLQIELPAWCEVDLKSLPFPPFISIVSEVVSDDGQTRTVQWNAGWPIDEVPKAIKHAIILMAGTLRDATPDEGGFLRKKTVEGVGSREYTLPDGAADAMKATAERLLMRWRIW